MSQYYEDIISRFDEALSALWSLHEQGKDIVAQGRVIIKYLRDAKTLAHQRELRRQRNLRYRAKLNSETLETSQKEETKGKENLSPTPPIREKGSKEEEALLFAGACAREYVREDGSVFKAPTVETVKTFCFSKNWRHVDAEYFVTHYEANEWKDGNGQPITNWQACAHKWELREKKAERKGAHPVTGKSLCGANGRKPLPGRIMQEQSQNEDDYAVIR